MDPPADLDAVRKKATAYLHQLLQHHAARSPAEAASAIAELAFQDGNPLKDLFAATLGQGRDRPESSREMFKARNPRGILRLGRSKTGSDSKAPVTGQQQQRDFVTPESIDDPSRIANKGLPINSVPTASKPPKASGSNPYQCIICDEPLSSKGVCKRHLEDQHVSPKQYKCEKCAEIFALKAKAKEHVKECGQGIFLWVVVKLEEKRVYACEFTGNVFSSMSKYLDHLLSLSEKVDNRPRGDLHRKLRGLLNQSHLRLHVEEISQRLYFTPSAWRSLQWNTSELVKAIEKLEYAVAHENGTLEFSKHIAADQRVQDTQIYVYSLLCEASLPSESTRSSSSGRQEPRSSSASMDLNDSSKTITPKASLVTFTAPDHHSTITIDTTAQGTILNPTPPLLPSTDPMPPPTTPAELRNKRHLSDYSRSIFPLRLPPGPPNPSNLPLAYSTMANTSNSNISTTLPYRPPDSAFVAHQSLPMDVDPLQHQQHQPQHHYPPSIASTAESSASDSTMMSYQEPELVTPMSYEFPLWPQQNNVQYNRVPTYHNHHHQHHHHHLSENSSVTSLPNSLATTHVSVTSHPNSSISVSDASSLNSQHLPQHFYGQRTSSTRTPSIATDQTCVMDYGLLDPQQQQQQELQRKLMEFGGGMEGQDGQELDRKMIGFGGQEMPAGMHMDGQGFWVADDGRG